MDNKTPGKDSLDDALVDEIRAQRSDSMSGPDSPEGRALGAAVGRNLSRLREVRRMDLELLAAKTGIGESLLAALESGEAVPSLRAIWHLATALEVPFGSLLAHTQLTSAGDPDFRVQRSSRGRLISSASGEFRSRVLFSEGDPRTPEVYELRLTPGCVEEADPHAHDTYEHIVVLRGTLVVRSGEARAVLEAGDSIFFRADSPHGYENPGLQDTLAHLVMVYGARP